MSSTLEEPIPRPRRSAPVALAVAFFVTATAPLQAHHSRAMFDVSRNITFRGIVKEYRWQNPHSTIVVSVAPDAGNPAAAGIWTVEASAVSLMTSRGWTPTTYKRGDPITVVVHPHREGSRLVLLFYAVRSDGTRLYRAAHRYEGEKE